MNDKTGVGALFLSSSTSRVLLNLRAPYKTHSLRWSLWGGMLEAGELPKDALFRELEEEMGLIPDIEKIYPFDIYESRDKHFRYYSFVCVVEDEFIPILNCEAVAYSWIKLGLWPKPTHAGLRQSFGKPKSLDKLHMILDQHTAKSAK